MHIEIFGAPNCTYCKQAQLFCVARDIPFTYTDIMKEEGTLGELLTRIGNFKTVPQIFIDGEHVGGFDGMKEAIDGDGEG